MWPAFWKKHCESILEVGIAETSGVEEMRRNFSAFAKYLPSVHLEMGRARAPRTDVVAASGFHLVHLWKRDSEARRVGHCGVLPNLELKRE